MDYKSKYNNALERARKLKENPQSVFNEYSPKEGDTICDYIFPELKESEDKKIKNKLIKLIKMSSDVGGFALHKWEADEMLAWLEKQGEQKPIEEVNGEDYGIDGLWHAQRILEETLGSVDGYQTDDGILSHKCAITAVKKLYEQKPAWDEKDEKEYKYVLKFVDNILNNCGNKKDYEHSKRCYDWLKSLRPQPKQEWSEEDQNALEDVREAVVHYWGGDSQDILLYWLKSIKQKIKGE